jgi:hypothetical protein
MHTGLTGTAEALFLLEWWHFEASGVTSCLRQNLAGCPLFFNRWRYTWQTGSKLLLRNARETRGRALAPSAYTWTSILDSEFS